MSVKKDMIYNEEVGKLEIYLVSNKILPENLSTYHGNISVNIETVDVDDNQEYEDAIKNLKHIYKTLTTDEVYVKFNCRFLYHEDVDEIEILG